MGMDDIAYTFSAGFFFFLEKRNNVEF